MEGTWADSGLRLKAQAELQVGAGAATKGCDGAEQREAGPP